MVRTSMLLSVRLGVLLAVGSTFPGCGRPSPTETFADRSAETQAESIISAMPLEVSQLIEGTQSGDGPEGALFGVRLANGHRYYLLGELVEGSIVPSGSALEDEGGNLILLQERTARGHRVTLATGDSVDVEIQSGSALYAWTLRGTEPPSVIVVRVDNSSAVAIDSSRSSIEVDPNPSYGIAPIRLPRAASGKVILGARTGLSCPGLGVLFDSFELLCILGQYSPGQVSKAAVQQMCISLGLFLDSARGSVIFMGQNQELAPAIIARLKFGLTIACAVLEHLTTIGRTGDTIGVAVGATCNLLELVKEGARIVAPDGRSLQQQICDRLYPDGAEPITCEDTCTLARDGVCDDGRNGASTGLCGLGTDCTDCGIVGEPIPGNPDCGADSVCSPACAPPTVDPDCTQADLCTLFDLCCANDGRCDARSCPSTDPDPDCSATELCEGRGFCCSGDGVCDLNRCPSHENDPDCTNIDYCARREQCCDDNRCDSPDIACPETDGDCAYCGQEDDLCIVNCDPPDPDCAVGRWVRVGSARINPENADTEFINDSNPGDLDEVRYSLSATSIASTNRKVDNDVELWNVALGSSFNEPPVALTPGETIVIHVSFSSSGNVVAGFNPNVIFQVGGLGVAVTPASSFTYDPYSAFFDGISAASYSFVVPPTRDGRISITTFWWNCPACNVTWVYEKE